MALRLRPLPPPVETLLDETKAPPRLRAHLALVHDAACQLIERIHARWSELPLDEEAVRLGAAVHDIGKVIHLGELSGPGHAHEEAGRRLLLEHGWPEARARFAVTHARALTANDPLEDLLIAVADKVWKGKREDALEQGLVGCLAAKSGQEPWQVGMAVDDILTGVSEGAPERLAWQAAHAAP